jgi:HlyD family secretion protein
MVKNCALVIVLALAACAPASPEAADTFQGIVEHEERVLSFELPGRVAALAVQRGDQVAAGTMVATLDDSSERLVLARSRRQAEAAEARAGVVRAGSRAEEIRAMEAQLRAAAAVEAQQQSELQRTQLLTSSGARPAVALEEARSRASQSSAEREALEERLIGVKRGARPVERAGADAEAAAASDTVRIEERRLSQHELRAPGAGTVLDRHVEAGEVVGAGTPIFTVADPRRPYVDVFVPQQSLAGIRVGAAAQVRTDAVGPLPGRVELVSPRTEFTPRFLFSDRERPNLVVRVRVRVEDPEARLPAGVPAFVHVQRS